MKHLEIPLYEWLCHSNFSFLMGACHPEDYVKTAVTHGYDGIGLCDYDGIYGIVRFFEAKERLTGQIKRPLKTFYGSEMHLADHHHLPVVLRDTLTLYPINLDGYHELCQIITKSHEHSKNHPYIQLEELAKFPTKNLVAIQPMRGVIRHQDQKIPMKRVAILKEIFSQRLYLTVSRHLNASEDMWIRPTLDLAKATSTNILISNDCYFHIPQLKPLCDLLLAIRNNKTLTDNIEHCFINDERHLHNRQNFYARYHKIPGFESHLKNSLDLATSIEFNLKDLSYNYPNEFVPKHLTTHQYLSRLVWQGAHKKYNGQIPTKISELLESELTLVDQLNFSDYFLTVWDIVNWARAQNILCQGRGSAANSAICYVLGITAADPARFQLVFERFISVERGDPPDIDVDFEHQRREEVIQYVYRRYGRHRAAMVANVITFRRRGAIRACGKALGIAPHILDRASQLQNSRINRQSINPGEFAPDSISPPLQEMWLNFSKKLVGFPRHMGIHSGGFVISAEPLNKLVPCEPATMIDRTVVQWNKDDLETLGFFKIDLLCLGMLTAVHKALRMINKCYGRSLEFATIPAEDPATYEMIQKADTVGTFQVESRAQMSMLPRLRPQTFYDLVIQVGIIRPGPIQGGLIHPFLERRRGNAPVVYPHPELRKILERTLGVPIFQEQIMRIAMQVGDFTPGEADQLRKKIGSWSSQSKDLSELVLKLRRGMEKKGIEEHFIDQTISHLKGFAEYGFPESHAISFALIAYASCWIKCHYPAAFFTALLNSQPMGFYSPHTLIQNARRIGIPVLPICVRFSEEQATLEKQEASWGIRLGLSMIRGLRIETIQKVLEHRTTNQSQTFEQYLTTSGLLRHEVTTLATADAFHSFYIDRRSALWAAASCPIASLIPDALVHPFPKEDLTIETQRNMESYGTTLGWHPTTVVRMGSWPFFHKSEAFYYAENLASLPKNLIVKVFGMILVRQSPHTAKGMVFLTLEDATGFINLAFYPKVYEKFYQLVDSMGFLAVEGKLQKERESHSILVKKVFPPKPEASRRYQKDFQLEITIDYSNISDSPHLVFIICL